MSSSDEEEESENSDSDEYPSDESGSDYDPYAPSKRKKISNVWLIIYSLSCMMSKCLLS